MRLKFRILLYLMPLSLMLSAQSPDLVSTYINTYKSIAITEMQRSGIPASIILAQGIHETSAGTSDLVIASNNHFGIKCKTGWAGQVVYHDDDAKGECFRSYAAAEESYRDHSDYLKRTPRYSFLFRLDPEDYASWAYGLKKAGYATNVRYPEILIRLIENYDLQKYSLIAMGKLPPESDEGNLAKEFKRETLEGFTDSSLEKPSSTASWPEGLFSINAAKVIFAKAGMSLLAISNQYDVPLAHLLDFNDMSQDNVLNTDQLIFLQRKRKTGFTSFHVVLPGESMYTICQMEGIRYESVLEFNKLKPGEEPAAGEKIYLQTTAGTKPALRNSVSAKATVPSS
jgi:LysM repeat protein